MSCELKKMRVRNLKIRTKEKRHCKNNAVLIGFDDDYSSPRVSDTELYITVTAFEMLLDA